MLPEPSLPEPARRGRPRRWTDDRSRRAAYRARQREWLRQLEALYVALLQADWEDPEVPRAVQQAPDAEVVQVFCHYFRQRRRQP